MHDPAHDPAEHGQGQSGARLQSQRKLEAKKLLAVLLAVLLSLSQNYLHCKQQSSKQATHQVATAQLCSSSSASP
jgi:hypothetical protein